MPSYRLLFLVLGAGLLVPLAATVRAEHSEHRPFRSASSADPVAAPWEVLDATSPLATNLWVRVFSEQHAIQSMAIHSGPPSTVLVGTHDGDVMRSTNGGSTWQHIGPTEGSDFHAVVASRSSASTLLAGGQASIPGGLYYSTSGGTAWSHIGPAPSSGCQGAHWVSPVAYLKKSTGDAIFAVCQMASASLLRTQDHGSTWAILGAVGTAGVVIDDSQSPAAVLTGRIESGHTLVVRSTNEGDSWSAVLSLPGGYGLAKIAGSAGSPSRVYVWASNASGSHRLYRSNNAGSDWTLVSSDLPFALEGTIYPNTLAVDPSNASVLYAAAKDCGGVWRSKDSGTSWAELNTGLPSTCVRALAVDPANANTIYAGTEEDATLSTGGVYKMTIEEGAAPSPPQPTAPADGAIVLSTSPVTFTWNASAGTPPITYRVTTGPVTLCSTQATSCTASLPHGDYTWLITASNSYGSASSTPQLVKVVDSSCTYSLSTGVATVGAGGGSGAFTVNASGTGCSWAAVSNATWIQITAGASGTSSGAVSYHVDANGGPAARSGTVTVSGGGSVLTHTVTQSAPTCVVGVPTVLSVRDGIQTHQCSGGTAQLAGTVVSLDWAAVSNAGGYEIEVRRGSTCSGGVFETQKVIGAGLVSASLHSTLTPGTYCWRARAFPPGGGDCLSGYSSSCTFSLPTSLLPQSCSSDAACGAGRFCDFPVGSCGGGGTAGTCKIKPTQCAAGGQPVCGCNGRTYGNACQAASAGVTLQRATACGSTQPSSSLLTEWRSARPETSFRLPVKIATGSGEARVSQLSFDFGWDPDVLQLESVETGSGSTAAGKVCSHQTLTTSSVRITCEDQGGATAGTVSSTYQDGDDVVDPRLRVRPGVGSTGTVMTTPYLGHPSLLAPDGDELPTTTGAQPVVISQGAVSAELAWTPERPGTGQVVQLSDLSTGPVTGWLWDFGDGTTSTQKNPSHTYLTGGNKQIRLTAKGSGVTDSRTKTIEVVGVPGLSEAGDHIYVIPNTAHKSGNYGTMWISDAVLHNPAADSAIANLYLLERGQNNSQVAGRQVAVGPGLSLKLQDLVLTTFGESSASGGVLIGSDRPLVVTSRTFNNATTGTYGQYIAGPPVRETVKHGEAARLIQLTKTARYRTNVGFTNATSQRISMRVDLHARDGVLLKTLTSPQDFPDLQPFGSHQIDNVFATAISSDLADGYALVQTTTSGGKFFTYAAVIDNSSGDPINVVPVGRRLDAAMTGDGGNAAGSTESIFVPAAAHAPGVGGTQWRTDLEVHNPGGVLAQFKVELLRHKADNSTPVAKSFSLGPGQSMRYEDVLLAVFGLQDKATLRLTPTQGTVIATSRTYNNAPAGTYGQFIPGLWGSQGVSKDRPGRLVQLAQSATDSTGYRTNLGIVNTTAATLKLRLDLFSGSGTLLGTLQDSPDTTLPAFGFIQLDKVFRRVTGAAVSDGYAVLSTETAGAELLAYASVIDNRSGDPIFIPVRVGDVGLPVRSCSGGGYNPTTSVFHFKLANTTGTADFSVAFGASGDAPVLGDWDGDGVDTVGTFRNGQFKLRNSNTAGVPDKVITFGASGDQPVAGDWDGDGADEVGIFRSGTVVLKNDNGGPDITFALGAAGDLPVAGDWTGQGFDTVGVFRASEGKFFLRTINGAGPVDLTVPFGHSGDRPAVGDWDGDGVDTVGIYRGDTFMLSNSNTAPGNDIVYTFGTTGILPFAGCWQ